ncbi:MAG: glycosyltransferase family 39 protein [Candidatus Omnitrophica bacterium]|nr:glycosyltransferase family 39 protein [Candidatus Omnitrophota bacterium]
MKEPLFWIFLLALFLRLLVVCLGVGFDKDLTFFDARDYDRYAMNLLSGKGFTNGTTWASRTPLYPLFLAAIYFFFGHSYLAVRLTQSLLGAFSTLLFYAIFRLYFSKRVSLWATFLCACHPILISYAGNILSETLGLFLLALFLLVFLKGESHARSWGGGFLFGVLLLCRSPLIFFLPFVMVHLVREGKRPFHSLVGFCMALIVVLSPWTFRNYRLLHAFVPLATHGGTTFWDANNPNALLDPAKAGLASHWVPPGKVVKRVEGREILLSEVEGDRVLFKQGFLFWKKLLRENPPALLYLFLRKGLAAFSLHGGKNLPALFGFSLVYLVFLPWGLVLSLRLGGRPTLLYGVILQYLLCSLIFFGRAKYRMVIEPYLVVFVTLAFLKCVDGVLSLCYNTKIRTSFK